MSGNTHSCPSCGHNVNDCTELQTMGGGHADQSWHECPKCGKYFSFQWWVTEYE